MIYKERVSIPEESIVIINYELIWRRPELSKLRNFTLMLDESSKIKNEKTKQSKFILGLEPDNVILLSGTPTGGKYEELWSQCKLLGWNISKSTFLNQYTVGKFNKKLGFYQIFGYKNVERLKAKLREYGAVFMKTEDVFDLPNQNYIDVLCKTTAEYKKFEKDHIVKVGDLQLVGDVQLTKRLYRRYLAGYLNSNKLERLRELLESTEDRVLIFYNYNAELAEIEKICKQLKKPLSYIKGGLTDKHNYESKSNSVTLIQYQAGAMGHNLQKANKIIYFSPTDRVMLWLQSVKRVHRIGQERPVFYYKLITENSVDAKIYEALAQGKDYVDELFEEEE